MEIISNHSIGHLEAVFGIKVEYGYHYEALCTRDGCLNAWFMVKRGK